MLKEAGFEQVYIVCGYTDMRRSIDGLAAIIQQNFGLEPCSGSMLDGGLLGGCEVLFSCISIVLLFSLIYG